MGMGTLLPHLRRASGAKNRLGRRGERAAAGHLKRAGYRILGRNVRLAAGEVDLIALAPDGRTIVIVEVKTRDASTQGDIPPEASVTSAKRRTLITLTNSLIQRNGWHDRPVRVDVISVTWGEDGARITQFENAVEWPARSSSGARRASRGRRPRA